MTETSKSNVTNEIDAEKSETMKDTLILEDKPKLYAMRWVIIFFFAMGELCNTFLYSTFTPIATDLTDIYDKKAWIVTLAASLYMLMHPIFTFPASYMILNKGVAACVKMGVVMTIIGSSIRCLSLYHE